MQRVLDADIAGHLPQRHAARLRHEVVAGVFRAQPHLDGMAGEFYLFLPEPERFATGDPQLQFDQIEPGDRLGDGMLDLQPRIHLHEIEFARSIQQKLQRARTLVPNRPDGGDRDRAHPRPQLARHRR